MTKQLVKIYKDNCKPCKEVTKLLNDNNVPHSSIDMFEEGAIDKYKIMSVPITILFENEEEIDRVYGYNKEDLLELIEELNN